ncbi:SDR family NAD(P)-dependent oxidoreductase [Rhizobium sp. BK226]|uniref:SDR family NAD(P)-dependent oxidoreductase n=1 Tax=Rhizobium sp. BK226 TaxID=2587075 RepID=UPI003917C18A
MTAQRRRRKRILVDPLANRRHIGRRGHFPRLHAVANRSVRGKVDAAVSRLGGRAQGRAGHLSTAQCCDALVSEVPDVDILVNNVGVFQPADFVDASDEVWKKHWQINVMSGVRLSRAYAKAMAARNRGRIILISSESLQYPG